MRSVHAFLIRRLLAGTTLILLLAVGTVYGLVSRTLARQFDGSLAHRVQAFASLLFQRQNELSFEFSGELMPEYLPGPGASYFQLWLSDGRVVERSESLEALDDVDLELMDPIQSSPNFWTAPLPDGRSGRFVSQEILVHHVYPEEGPERPEAARVQVVIARGREALQAAERELLGYCALFACGVLLLIGLLARWCVRHGLSPALQLAAKLDEIQVDNLPEGLEVGELPQELLPMAQKADALIRRAVAALRRERRSSADIAHELRTPISELLTVSEVALRRPEDAAEHIAALQLVRDISQRMARAISSLLQLSNLESGGEAYDFRDLELLPMVQDELRSRVRLCAERNLGVQNELPRETPIFGDRDSIRIIVSNLIDNALHYAPEGTSIECSYRRVDRDWELCVTNPSAAFEPEELENLTQPFWRKDRARHDPNRFGLGLALSLALAERNQLALSFHYAGGHFSAHLRGSLPSDSSLPRLRLLG